MLALTVPASAARDFELTMEDLAGGSLTARISIGKEYLDYMKGGVVACLRTWKPLGALGGQMGWLTDLLLLGLMGSTNNYSLLNRHFSWQSTSVKEV